MITIGGMEYCSSEKLTADRSESIRCPELKTGERAFPIKKMIALSNRYTLKILVPKVSIQNV